MKRVAKSYPCDPNKSEFGALVSFIRKDFPHLFKDEDDVEGPDSTHLIRECMDRFSKNARAIVSKREGKERVIEHMLTTRILAFFFVWVFSGKAENFLAEVTAAIIPKKIVLKTLVWKLICKLKETHEPFLLFKFFS